jgi:ketosteroid isomerase-like protein
MSSQGMALEGVVAEYFAAVNAFDPDRIIETFAEDGLVNDIRREFWGKDAIGRWVAKEIVGDKVTVEVTEVIGHAGITIVRGRYDGKYDKTGIPDELILAHYFTLSEAKIESLIVIHNRTAE